MVSKQAKPRIAFLGAGRVAGGLSLALARCGYPVVAVASRARTSAEMLARRLSGCEVVEAANVARGADVVFLTVPDDALERSATGVRWRAGVAAVHCSGAAELAVLRAASAAGADVGGFHPLVMFADRAVAARSLAGCAIAVEAKGALREVLECMVGDLGARPLRIPAGARGAYHAAAHYAGPFIAALLAEGVALWARLGIAPEDALAALVPLARGSIESIAHSGLAQAMAGSVARGDLGTLRRHMEGLGALDAGVRDLYCRLALRTIPLALAARSIDETQAEAIRALLDRGLAQ